MPRIFPRSSLSSIVLFVCLIATILTVNHLYTLRDDPEVRAAKCNCSELPLQVITPVVPKVEIAISTTTVPPPPPCRPVETESAVQRAILIYYPHHQTGHFFPEIRW